MKRLLFLIAVLSAALLISMPAPASTSAAEGATKQRAAVKFDQPVIVMGVTLKGDYLFVHDDAAMARGDACTFVYKGNAEVRDNLIVAFHCTPKERVKVGYFTLRSRLTPSGQQQLTEFQFAGSTEGHLVPVAVE
jgi:hypothetical protein